MAARRRSKRDLHVVVTESDNTVTSLLVARGGFNQIRKNPISGLGQVVTTGDSAERSDQRTPQVILSDQTGGMGEFFYTETAGITSFTDSECETRFPGMVCLPPAFTLLGSAGALGATTAAWHVEYVNETNATRIAWASTKTSWRYTGSAWTQTSMPTGNGAGWALFNARYYLATDTGLWYSADGISWTQITFGLLTPPQGVIVHDNKLWVLTNSVGVVTLWQTTVGAVFADFTQLEQLLLGPGERPVQIQAWRDRVGREVIYMFTNQRLMLYDEDASQWLQFYRFTRRSSTAVASGWFEPWQRDGNAYAVLNTAARPETVYYFSGTTNRYAPNTRGGLPTASRFNLVHHRGGDNWLYFWGATRGNGAAATGGRVLAMNDQGAFHTLFLGITADQIVGGGYDEGLLWAVTTGGNVYELNVPDNTDLPLYVTAGERTYPASGTFNHEYAFTDGGTPLMNKQWLWVTVTCLDHTSANKVPGLAANTSVVVQYRRDVDTAWTTLGTLTSASTFPAVLPIAAGFGVKAKQLKVRLTLASTTANNTPIVTSVALAYTRQEVPRYAYSVPIDLGDRTHPLYKGKSIAQLLAAMDRWTQPGALVKFQMAGGDYATAPSTSTTVANATFAYSGQEDAERGPGTYTGLFSDYSTPASG